MKLEEAEQVFSILQSQWPANATMRLFFRNKEGATRGSYVLGPEQLASETEYATQHGWNSYVQMNPTFKKGSGRVSGADISHWSWLLVDIDPVKQMWFCNKCGFYGAEVGDFSPKIKGTHEGCNYLAGTTNNQRLTECVEFVESFMRNYLGVPDLRATIIDSGRGAQCWFPLEPWDLNTSVAVLDTPLSRDFEIEDRDIAIKTISLRDAAPRAMGYWLDLLRERMELTLPGNGCTIDTCSSDLPRVMRLPFTKNLKTGRTTGPIRIASGWNAGLAQKLINYVPYRIWKDPEPSYDMGAIDDDTPWQRFLPHLTVGARIFLTEGANEGGRHRQATAALLSLKELGCGPAQTQQALMWGASLCSPALEPREITPMISRHFQRRNV